MDASNRMMYIALDCFEIRNIVSKLGVAFRAALVNGSIRTSLTFRAREHFWNGVLTNLCVDKLASDTVQVYLECLSYVATEKQNDAEWGYRALMTLAPVVCMGHTSGPVEMKLMSFLKTNGPVMSTGAPSSSSSSSELVRYSRKFQQAMPLFIAHGDFALYNPLYPGAAAPLAATTDRAPVNLYLPCPSLQQCYAWLNLFLSLPGE